MNILFFLTPKIEVDYVYDDASIFKAMQIFDRHNYFALPLINKKGRYIGALTTSDLLGCIKENFDLSVKASADFPVRNVKRIRSYKAVNGGSTSMEEIVSIALDQNFVPVVDDDYNFIGIITRKSIMTWMHERYHVEHPGEKNELKTSKEVKKAMQKMQRSSAGSDESIGRIEEPRDKIKTAAGTDPIPAVTAKAGIKADADVKADAKADTKVKAETATDTISSKGLKHLKK